MSKDAILGAIRRGLKRGPLPADQRAMLEGRLATHPRHLIPARSRLPRPEQIALFIRNVEKEFGTVERVPDLSAIPAAVADFLAAQNLPARLVVAPHPELASIDWSARPMIEREARAARGWRRSSPSDGWAGVAERDDPLPLRPVAPHADLLPETGNRGAARLRRRRRYEEAWDRLRAERQDAMTGGFMPRNLMFVTGPSRSADIEQTLELGAHGPRRLHVLLVEDEPPPHGQPRQARAEAPVPARPAAAPGD